MLTIKIHTDSAAFDDDLYGEIRRILQRLPDRLEQGIHDGLIWDTNGNRVGSYELTFSEDED